LSAREQHSLANVFLFPSLSFLFFHIVKIGGDNCKGGVESAGLGKGNWLERNDSSGMFNKCALLVRVQQLTNFTDYSILNSIYNQFVNKICFIDLMIVAFFFLSSPASSQHENPCYLILHALKSLVYYLNIFHFVLLMLLHNLMDLKTIQNLDIINNKIFF